VTVGSGSDDWGFILVHLSLDLIWTVGFWSDDRYASIPLRPRLFANESSVSYTINPPSPGIERSAHLGPRFCRTNPRVSQNMSHNPEIHKINIENVFMYKTNSLNFIESYFICFNSDWIRSSCVSFVGLIPATLFYNSDWYSIWIKRVFSLYHLHISLNFFYDTYCI
jgi:hypothetical protein